VLLIEATVLDRDAAMAHCGHLTTARPQHARAGSGVKQLVLTHISSRYSDEQILREATIIFRENRLDR
jgi:ribonuclease Z